MLLLLSTNAIAMAVAAADAAAFKARKTGHCNTEKLAL